MNINKTTIKAWIQALRPRTLPLSLSVLFLGSGLAAMKNAFSWPIFIFTVLTGMFLQALSDFANDYGDAMNNLDGADRVGPLRTVSSGAISPKQMLLGMGIVMALTVTSTIILLALSFGYNLWKWFCFGLLLLSAIWAAIRYTAGKNPYGYKAQGDYYVFVFFGLVAVLGSYYLYTGSLENAPILPAMAAGFFATGVLNINNTRDMEGDSKRGKITIANKLGPKGARIYQLCLIGSGVFAWVIYLAKTIGGAAVLLVLFTLPLIKSTYNVYTSYDAKLLDKQLRNTALGTAFFHILMALALPCLY